MFDQLLVESGSGAQEAEYDADRVETLKKDLMNALKNGSHIRRLKPDEALTVVVAGRGGKGATKLTIRQRHTGASGGGIGGMGGMGGGMSGGGLGGMGGGGMMTWTGRAAAESQGSRLILRARKSDIDAFQKDKLSLDDFCKKVTVIAE